MRTLPPRNSPHFVLFGGSFSPVHAGHVAAIQRLAQVEGVSQVLVMPAAQSPFKPGIPALPADLRYRMVCAATAGLERVAVLDWELCRPPPSYTAATVARLRHVFPTARLWLAMGLDVYTHIAQWHRPAEVLESAGLMVFPRAGMKGEICAAPPDRDCLPPPWSTCVHREPGGHLVCPDGRRLVWWVPMEIPPVAASDILRTRDLRSVPAAARPMLEEYWRQAGAPAFS